MSFSAAFHAQFLDRHAVTAMQFLADPLADARAWAQTLPADSYSRHEVYPYSLGVAEAIIGSLLDAAGYPVLGPDRFDCEWALTHPVEDDEYEAVVS